MIHYRNLLLLFLFLSFIVTSCGTDADTPPDAEKPTFSTENSIKTRIKLDISSLNPYLYGTIHDIEAAELMFQYPLQFDPISLKLLPQLAKGMPVEASITEGEYKGGRTFTFEFFEEAKWDDGTPVTGHDYAFTMKVIFNPKLNQMKRFRSYLDHLREVRVDETNPKKFTVYSDKPYIIDAEALSNMMVLPQHLYDKEGLLKDFELKELSDKTKAAALAEVDARLQQFADAFQDPKFSREEFHGSGPYKLVEWVEGQRVVFEKKSNWWGTSLSKENPMLHAFPDEITYVPIKDDAPAAIAMRNGELDVFTEMDSKLYLEMKEDPKVMEQYNFYTPTRLVYFYTAMQNQNPKLNDKRVRRALAHIVDMDEVIEKVYFGFGERIVSGFLSHQPYYNAKLKLIEKDLEKAKSLLTEAGWVDSNNNGVVDKMIDGELVEMNLEFLYTPTVPFQNDLSEIFKNSAKQVGINIERVGIDANALGTRLRNGEYELAGRGAGAAPTADDPRQLWHTDNARPGGSNYWRFGNAETDAMIEEIRTTSDVTYRDSLYRKFQEIIYEEQPVIFLFSPQNKIAVHKRFDGPISKYKTGVSLPSYQLRTKGGEE